MYEIMQKYQNHKKMYFLCSEAVDIFNFVHVANTACLYVALMIFMITNDAITPKLL